MLSVKVEANHRLWMITYWTEIHSGEGPGTDKGRIDAQ